MSRGKAKATYKPRTFEAIGAPFRGLNGTTQADTSAAIFESMLQSNAFKSLKPRQKILYVYCKSQYYGKRKPGRDYSDTKELQGDDLFYFNLKLAVQYELYTEGCSKNFYSDMQELVSHGLIERVVSGKRFKGKSIYKYSNKWQSWKKS